MPIEATKIIMNTALDTLAAKYSRTADDICSTLAAGHKGLRGEFDHLIELGRQVAIRTTMEHAQTR